MSDKFSAWNTLFLGKPIIKELSGNRVLLSGKCRWCFGNGRTYIFEDYEPCTECKNGFRSIMLFN